MNPDDPILQRRLRELCDDDKAGAPPFQRVLRGPARPTSPVLPRLLMAAALTAVIVLVLTPHHGQEPLPEVSMAAIEDLEAADWTPLSDALLVDASAPSNADLMREIHELLSRP